jgi:hypothetical protein
MRLRRPSSSGSRRALIDFTRPIARGDTTPRAPSNQELSFLAASSFEEIWPTRALARLLFYPQKRVLCGLSDSEFDDSLSGILSFCCVLGLKPVRAFLFCFTNFPKTRQEEFPVLLDRFVGEVAERIKEYSSGSFVGLRGCGQRDLKFSLGHL